MATVSNQDFFELNLQNLIAENRLEQTRNKKKEEEPQALLISLTKSLEEIADQIASAKAGPGVSAPPTSSNGPTNGQMQQAIGALAGMLSELEAEIAQWMNEKSQANNEVGEALITELTAQVKQSQKELLKTVHETSEQAFWSKFLKVVEGAVGVLIAAIAIFCAQPELAVAVLVSTVLSTSGAMDKLTQVIAKGLQDMHVPETAADVLASATVVLTTIIATILTCGAAAGSVIEEVPDAAGEAIEGGVNAAETGANVAQSAADTVTDTTQNFAQRLQQILSKAVQTLKNGGPFRSLPKPVNMGIFTGSQAIMSTNFGQNLAKACLSHMQDGKTKEALTAVIESLVDLLAIVAGAASTAATFAGSAAQATRSSSVGLMSVLERGKLFGYGLQAIGETTQGVVNMQLAFNTNDIGKTQALISILQALVSMNNNQMQSDTKSESSTLRAHAEGLETLTADLNKATSALTQVLQA